LAEEIVGFRLDGGSSCITCGRSMGICAHCFSKDIYLYLKERGSPIADEFIGRFDFDLRKQFV